MYIPVILPLKWEKRKYESKACSASEFHLQISICIIEYVIQKDKSYQTIVQLLGKVSQMSNLNG
jgi:hypothetical protein